MVDEERQRMLEEYTSEILKEMRGGGVFDQLTPNERLSYEVLQTLLSSTIKTNAVSCREHVNMIVDLALKDSAQLSAFASQYGTSELRDVIKSISSLDGFQVRNILMVLREQFRKYIKPPAQGNQE